MLFTGWEVYTGKKPWLRSRVRSQTLWPEAAKKKTLPALGTNHIAGYVEFHLLTH